MEGTNSSSVVTRIRNVFNEQLDQTVRFMRSKWLAYLFMMAYITMLITLLIMAFVLVSNFFTRQMDDNDEPEEETESRKISEEGFGKFSGLFYLLGLLSVVGCVLCFGHCRWCPLCGAQSPHYQYEEIV